MKLKILFTGLVISLIACQPQENVGPASKLLTPFEKGNGNQSPSYEEGMRFWYELAQKSPHVAMEEYGNTDANLPLHLMIWSADGSFSSEQAEEKNKHIVFINNAIHPGEPDGVDATMLLFRDLSANDSLKEKFKDIVLVAIPYYNIGGALQRNTSFRANQNGPEEYGFRGNAKNYDLNRDFIKMDSDNMWAFARYFHKWNPLVFIDNHVSNGADYQYVVTYLSCQEDKLGEVMGPYQRDKLNPLMEEKMTEKNHLISPYVNVFGRQPEKGGIVQFFDSPRYASGFGGLFQSFSYTVETHMLKPYKDRVLGTYDFMLSLCEIIRENGNEMEEIKENQQTVWLEVDSIPLQWKLDSQRVDSLNFHGYHSEYIPSELTGAPRLKYHQDQAKTFEIPFYNRYQASLYRPKPKAYLIPQAWKEIMDRMKRNGVKSWSRLEKDSLIQVNAIKVKNFETLTRPFEGHYLHYNTEVEYSPEKYQARKGDFLVELESDRDFFIMSVLEPEAIDSYFNWNFFDTYLQQKEGYSSYVFEDKALEILAQDPELKSRFEEKKDTDPSFASNPAWQLYWVYTQSEHYEDNHMRLPVFRIEKDLN